MNVARHKHREVGPIKFTSCGQIGSSDLAYLALPYSRITGLTTTGGPRSDHKTRRRRSQDYAPEVKQYTDL